jgi:hypothetical protein
VALSSPDDVVLNQRILARIRAAVRNLSNVKSQIQKDGIKADTDDSLSTFLVGIVGKVEQHSDQLLAEIEEITNRDTKIERSDLIHRNLELLLFHIEVIRTSALHLPTELYWLTRTALRELGHEDIRVVLVPHDSLSTTNLSDGLKSILQFFDDALKFVSDSFPFYWIVFVPPSFTRTPLNWPLIAHEIGHILEKQKWRAVGSYYTYPIHPSLSLPKIKSFYAQEFQADFVAVSYFGPIFARRLLECYYTREFDISMTHPSWKERFEAMADHLNSDFPDEAEMLKTSGATDEVATISRSTIEHLDNVFSKTRALLSALHAVYVQDPVEEKSARDKLRRFVAYTADMRTLLNVADRALDDLRESVADPKDKANIEKEFDYLVMDSIRLNYIRQLSQSAFS